MTVKLYFEEVEYDYYSRGGTEYAIRVSLTDTIYNAVDPGEVEDRREYFLFGVPDDWARDRAERYGQLLRRASYDHLTYGSTVYSNLLDAVRAMIRAEDYRALYRQIAEEPQ